MTFYDSLLHETHDEREAFLAVPLVAQAISQGVDRAVYLDFLGEAYHHVKETTRLLALALFRTAPQDRPLSQALLTYLNEEYGHEVWILDDIAALGGDAKAVEAGQPGQACRIMVGYIIWAIEEQGPHAFLGMGHVLEGMSVALADQAAKAIASRMGRELGTRSLTGGKGFSYLTSHGKIDRSHVEDFKTLVNGLEDPKAERLIVETAKVIYRLYGDIFAELDQRRTARAHAA